MTNCIAGHFSFYSVEGIKHSNKGFNVDLFFSCPCCWLLNIVEWLWCWINAFLKLIIMYSNCWYLSISFFACSLRSSKHGSRGQLWHMTSFRLALKEDTFLVLNCWLVYLFASFHFLFFFFYCDPKWPGTRCVAQAALELAAILPSQALECWDCRYEPCLLLTVSLKRIIHTSWVW